jgi:hypothetical protein
VSRFSAPWDRTLKVTTGIVSSVLVLVAASLIVLPALGGAEAEELRPILLGPAILVAAIAPAAWLLGPRGFAIEGGALVVERPLWPVRIPLGSIRAVELLPEGSLRGAIRVAGSSAFFGYYGRFWSRRLGLFRMYATRRTGLVLVDAGPGRFVLSPWPSDGFAQALLARAPRAERTAPPPPPGGMPRAAWIPLAAAAVAIPVLLGGVLGASWALGPRGAAVEEGAVVIERNWASPVELPLSSIREARLLHPEERRGWRRVSGVAMGRLAYGRFSSRGLGRFRLYAWRDGPCVLLELDGDRVVLTPDDAGRFLDDLRRRTGR